MIVGRKFHRAKHGLSTFFSASLVGDRFKRKTANEQRVGKGPPNKWNLFRLVLERTGEHNYWKTEHGR